LLFLVNVKYGRPFYGEIEKYKKSFSFSRPEIHTP
jgi:hypothetical protein